MSKGTHVLFLFLDGVGLGADDPEVNPLFAAELPVLRSLLGDVPSRGNAHIESSRAIALPLDANLGVRGLPQSGTGQAALMAGFNAPRAAGHHFGPFPPHSVRKQIARRNIFRRVVDAGLRPCFANAFPQRFFDYVAAHQFRLSMTTLSCSLSGLPLRQFADLKARNAISAELTNEGWRAMGYTDLPRVSPQESGQILADLSSRHEFTLFEYWKTDFAGHAQDRKEAVEVLERFDAMLEGVLAAIGRSRTMVVLTSDHGNIEDLSVKTHTRNPVPLVAFGHGHRAFASLLGKHRRPNLSHVTPAIMEMFGAG